MSRRRKPKPEIVFIIHKQAKWSRSGMLSFHKAKMMPQPNERFAKLGEVYWVLAVRKDKVGEWGFEELDALDPDTAFAMRQTTKRLTDKPLRKKRTDSRDVLHRAFVGEVPTHCGPEISLSALRAQMEWQALKLKEFNERCLEARVLPWY